MRLCSPRPATTLPALALSLSVLGAATACGGGDDVSDGAVQLAPGVAAATAAGAETRRVVLPDGALELSWTAEPGVLAQARTLAGDDLPDSEGLLLVEWATDPAAPELTSSPGQLLAQGDADDELALVSGGERTVLDVDGLGRRTGRVAVVVADPDDVSLEVAFDGVVQSVGPGPDQREVPAVAQVLYDGQPASGFESCAGAAPAGSRAPSCRVAVVMLPWVEGVGWAPEGQLWPVVAVEGLEPPGAPTPTSWTTTVTVDGAAPVAQGDYGSEPSAVLAFPATGEADVPVAAELVATYGDGSTATTRGEVDLTPGAGG